MDCDDVEYVGEDIRSIANAITPTGAVPTRDESGNYVGSLTEAVMSVASALREIAGSLRQVATAIEETKD